VKTRRDFLRDAAALAGGASIAGRLLSSIARAAEIDPVPASSFLDAEHVVILMQENRSFDHVFGMLRGVRGFHDPRAVTLPDGNPVWLQSNAAGETYAPFRLNLKETKATWLGSLPHSWPDQIDARNHGNHDGWLEAKRSHRKEFANLPLTMGFYDREDLPFYYALADAFTVCDQHFCSSLTGTTPNRLHLWTGTIREKPEAGSTPKVRNADVDYGSTVHWKTFPERLQEAGISWRVYQNELSLPSGLEDEGDAWLANFTDNPLEWFDQYGAGFRRTHREYVERMVVELPAEIEKMRSAGASKKEIDKKQKLLDYSRTARAQWTAEGFAQLSEHELSLHRNAFTTNEADPAYRELCTLAYRENGVDLEMAVAKGDPFFQFRKDVEEGKLPAVSWLVPSERFSDHPGSPWYGAWYVSEALNVLTQNPEVWRKTIFILTYDENDGYFDHVPPFVAPDPRDPESGKTSPGIDPRLEYLPLEDDRKQHKEDEARGGPVGLGYRVPLIVASPWSRGGFVCSQVFDHTSVLQVLEHLASRWAGKEVRETNITAWRRAVCGDLMSVFRRFEEGSPKLAFPARDSFFEQVYQAQFTPMPSGYRTVTREDIAQYLPRQERGVRPSSALPYELWAGGEVTADRQHFEIALEARTGMFGQASAGAPFHVYTPGKFRGETKRRARAYAVEAGSRITDRWALEGFDHGIYHLRICGPNGFFRELRGSVDDPGVEIRAEYERTGDIQLRIATRTAREARIVVKNHGYKVADRALTVEPGRDRSVFLKLAASYHWYDFSVTVDGADRYLRRFAGRVETGKDGFSDPVMGA
jgi:phospholipase C